MDATLHSRNERMGGGERPVLSLFKQQLETFWDIVGITPAEFHPTSMRSNPPEADTDEWQFTKWIGRYDQEWFISRATLFELYALRIDLQRNTARKLQARLQILLNIAFDRARKGGTLRKLERRLSKSKLDFVNCKSLPVDLRSTDSVDLHALEDLYDLSKARNRLGATAQASKGRYKVSFIFEQSPDELKVKEFAKQVTRRVMDNDYEVERVRDGCTELVFDDVSEHDAQRLHELFIRGELAPGVIAMRIVPSAATHANELSKNVIHPHDAGVDSQIERAVRQVMLSYRINRPLHHLRAIGWGNARYSPQRDLIGESDLRCYAAPDLRSRRSLLSDLGTCWIAWPILTAALLALILGGLRLAGLPLAVGIGLVSTMILALVGAQVCAAVVSPLACAAGSVVMALGFGVSHALIAGGVNRPLFDAQLIQNDMFGAVTGGLIGLAAPAWRDYVSPAGGLAVLAPVAAAIASAGWLMAQPKRAESLDAADAPWLRGAVLGSSVGAGIGAVYGLTALFRLYGLSEPLAFAVAFVPAGSLIFGTTVWLRLIAWQRDSGPLSGGRNMNAIHRASVFAAVHAVVSATLVYAVFTFAGSTAGILALAAATSWFHATFFTGAYLTGAHFGSVKSAVIATTIEGSVGFTLAILLRAILSTR
jgi:hypothetical protein